MQSTHKHFQSQSSVGGVVSDLLVGSAQPELVACPTPSGMVTQEHGSAHPCLTDNNSIKIDNEELRYRKERKERENKYYNEIIKPKLTGYQNKSTDLLQMRIEKGSKEHGEESVGVLHLTFAEEVDYQTAQDRINSLATNIFRKRYKINDLNYYITICEKGGKNGRIHFHVLFIKEGADFKTGTRFQWSERDKKEKIYANPELRKEWEFYREQLPKYGFGISMVRVEPLKSTEGGARYFSKYVGKGHYTRDESMHGKQLIRPSNGFRKYIGTKKVPVYENGRATEKEVKFTAQQQINYIGGISSGRRVVLGDVGACHGATDISELNYKFGSHWQHYCKDQIRACACFAGYRIGKHSKEWVVLYAQSQWSVKVEFGINDKDHEVLGAHYQGEFMNLKDLYEFALDKLLDRIEVAEEFQYDDRMPIAQNLNPQNIKPTQDTKNEIKHETKQLDGRHGQTNVESFRQLEIYGSLY